MTRLMVALVLAAPALTSCSDFAEFVRTTDAGVKVKEGVEHAVDSAIRGDAVGAVVAAVTTVVAAVGGYAIYRKRKAKEANNG